MGERIRIVAKALAMTAELNDSETARAVLEALPIRASVRRWGQEIYFEVGVDCGAEAGARDVMDVGELAYWPPGKAFCIFFGPTPASRGDEPRAASAVNPVGRLEGDATRFASVGDGTAITIERA